MNNKAQATILTLLSLTAVSLLTIVTYHVIMEHHNYLVDQDLQKLRFEKIDIYLNRTTN